MPLDRSNPLSEAIQSQISKSGLPSRTEKKADRQAKEQLVQKNIRLSQSDWDSLETILAHKGLSISSGLRMIVKEYINNSK